MTMKILLPSVIVTIMLAPCQILAFQASPSLTARHSYSYSLSHSKNPLRTKTVSVSQGGVNDHRRYRSTSNRRGWTWTASSTEDIDRTTEPVFEDVDGIGELTLVGGIGETTSSTTSSSTGAGTATVTDVISATETASTAAAVTAVTQLPGVGVEEGNGNGNEVMTAFPPFVEPQSTILDDEILIVGSGTGVGAGAGAGTGPGTGAASLIDPSAIVENIIENALSPGADLNSIDIDISATTPAAASASVSVSDVPPKEPVVLSEEEVLFAEKKQLLDPSVVVEEIIGTALSDPGVHGQVPAEGLRVEEEKVLKQMELEQAEEQDEDSDNVQAPNLKKIVTFAIPAIGVWLCSPLLSLIDTSSVGLLSGTVQQAALNPAVAVTDYSALLVAFMYTATTNLVASARAKEPTSVVATEKNQESKTSKTLVHALQLSGYVGLALGFTLSTMAPFLLRKIIGNDAIDPRVFAAALRYVRIRAWGMPAAVIIGSAQSACIGMQDIKSPMYVLIAAALVNLMGDIMFVPSTNPWLGGAAGAALATVFSQYAALGLFIKWLTSKPKSKPETTQEQEPPVNLTKAILELTGKSSEGRSRRMKFRKALQKVARKAKHEDGTSASVPQPVSSPSPLSKLFQKREKNAATEPSSSSTEEIFSTRGFLADKFTMRDLTKFPPKKEAKEFWPYVIPVSTTSVGRVSAYVAMSHVVSSSLGTLSMAANQVILSVFYCLCPVADSLNLTAQSFIPGIFQSKKGPARTNALKTATGNFIKVASMFGAASAAFVGLIPFFSKYFTSDPLVIAQVNSAVPLLAGIFAVHGLVCAGEGLLLGQRDLGYIGRAYFSYFFAVPYLMLRLKKIALAGSASVNLNSLWQIFLGYQFVRVATWASRIWLLNKRSTEEIVEDAPVPVPVTA